jgi:hypothetical protein
MRKLFLFKNMFLVLLAIFIFQGCAALTLDVDVYKGPLANDKDILTQ